MSKPDMTALFLETNIEILHNYIKRTHQLESQVEDLTKRLELLEWQAKLVLSK